MRRSGRSRRKPTPFSRVSAGRSGVADRRRRPHRRSDASADGYYIAKESTEFLAGLVRGRYSLEGRRIQLKPFAGQGIYARSNGEFGLVERTRELDYYDGELQFIDREALSQSVTVARKRPGTDAPVVEKDCRRHVPVPRRRRLAGRHLAGERSRRLDGAHVPARLPVHGPGRRQRRSCGSGAR